MATNTRQPPPQEEDTSPGWIDAVKGELPNGATVGGYMGDEQLYIARGMIDGCWVPGSLRPSEKILRVAWRKKERKLKKFQVLVYAEGKFEPLTVEDEIPIGSVSGGECDTDEDIFIGRVKHEGSLIIGRISPSEGACHIPYNGQQIAYKDNFEIFTMKEPEKEKPKDVAKDNTKETPKDNAKEKPKDIPKDNAKEKEKPKG